ncbi:MAG TPA: GlsB/YeaQ/YmgE family stress response membrane protein [Pirellulales bacterium]
MDAPTWLIDGAHQLFEWTGFGLIVGLAARAIMPGKDPDGAGATLLTGAGGAVLGCGSLALFLPQQQVSPLSVGGFLAAIAGGFCLLAFYRVMSGKFHIVRELPKVVIEGAAPAKRSRRRAKAAPQVVEVDH